MKAIVTGGLGFIGYNFYELYKSTANLLVLDKRSYASNPYAEKNIAQLEIMDIGSPKVYGVLESFQPDVIFNFAAESHVDRSILDPGAFLKSNVEGTCNLLEAARRYDEARIAKGLKRLRFVQVSTDEVYGSLGETGYFTEDTQLQPNSPYSASKAAADCFVRSYHHTFKLDTVTTRCTNNYGPWHFPEKLIPVMICNALENKKLPVYGTGKNVRDWIYVEDHCRGVMTTAERGRSGEVYNFGGHAEKTNLEIVKTLLSILGKPESLIEFVTDRKGHDFRYAMDCSKVEKEFGWKPLVNFEQGIKKTVEWNLAHKEWLDYIRSGSYRAYYEANYGHR